MAMPGCPICQKKMERMEIPPKRFYYRCFYHGVWTYFQLFLMSVLGGHVAYLLTGDTIPSLGASGGVMGLGVYYCLAFPHNRFRLGFMTFWQMRFHWTSISFNAYSFLFFYLALQIVGFIKQGFGLSGSSINYVAHLGGALVGLLFYFLF